jgi:hypothetical protein
LDSGATENFIHEKYAKWLQLPFKTLAKPRAVYNVDGMLNKNGQVKYYTNLKVQTGKHVKNMRFFLTELSPQRLILGYPWFVAAQPNIDWSKGWLDYKQLPVVLRTENAWKSRPVSRFQKLPCPKETGAMHVAYVSFPGKAQTMASKLAEEHSQPNTQTLPAEYQRHKEVFSEKEAQRFPGPRLWDHAIELTKDTPPTLSGKIYSLTQPEQEALTTFIDEHLKKGYIKRQKALTRHPSSLKRKMESYTPSKIIEKSISEW